MMGLHSDQLDFLFILYYFVNVHAALMKQSEMVIWSNVFYVHLKKTLVRLNYGQTVYYGKLVGYVQVVKCLQY